MTEWWFWSEHGVGIGPFPSEEVAKKAQADYANQDDDCRMCKEDRLEVLTRSVWQEKTEP
jgi:hypothetical protein